MTLYQRKTSTIDIIQVESLVGTKEYLESVLPAEWTVVQNNVMGGNLSVTKTVEGVQSGIVLYVGNYVGIDADFNLFRFDLDMIKLFFEPAP